MFPSSLDDEHDEPRPKAKSLEGDAMTKAVEGLKEKVEDVVEKTDTKEDAKSTVEKKTI